MANYKDTIYLRHIIQEINKVEMFVQDISEKQFVDENATEKHYAVVRGLEIIGEACNKISNEFKILHPAINWKNAIGMRNKIIHEYMDVDYKIVWDTIKIDLVKLKQQITDIL